MVKPRGKTIAILALANLCLIVPAMLQAQKATALKAFYDDLGQLTTVIDPSGNVATYTYDAVGNILQITKSRSV
jgi:YD repeat-containing protein